MGRKSARSLWSAKLAGQGVASPESSDAAVEQHFAARREPFDGLVLGVDPSLRGTGLAVVSFTPGQQAKLVGSRTLKFKPAISKTECLGEIARAVTEILDAEPITCVALEQTIYVQNFQTAQILGMARGAAIAVAAMRGLPIHEYAPLRIKQAVVGYGRASKEQVAAMVRQQLGLLADLPLDEADAAATAICHALTGPR
ncbi:crossover junction endodeoxyribonuclease RuvC [Cerasicoccus arenae]|uniref:Crossover junction endodeoxyribonuclease RuvC n=1 Tax=Cerasicoccus arenae TaxID=424488 RepID=A0A8J3DEW6_9BACT|nr:crossover junction endodeoxyribonuclease RuvC [Cerasicoccus arenae]MBK1857170.1 crossover junction endodeoxyribonuclease RuvC [Cerasicoccus arenae]GHB92761.1 crossover junction endodeoxyribonuclease RuvC [Cerasicoccus arenae]